jgi:hypothetical protein
VFHSSVELFSRFFVQNLRSHACSFLALLASGAEFWHLKDRTMDIRLLYITAAFISIKICIVFADMQLDFKSRSLPTVQGWLCVAVVCNPKIYYIGLLTNTIQSGSRLNTRSPSWCQFWIPLEEIFVASWVSTLKFAIDSCKKFKSCIVRTYVKWSPMDDPSR